MRAKAESRFLVCVQNRLTSAAASLVIARDDLKHWLQVFASRTKILAAVNVLSVAESDIPHLSAPNEGEYSELVWFHEQVEYRITAVNAPERADEGGSNCYS